MNENEPAEGRQNRTTADSETAGPDGGGSGATDGEVDAADTPADPVDADSVEPAEELVADVSAADPEQVAREIAALRERANQAERAIVEREDRIADLEETVEDLESRLKRKQADFRNYKKRMEKRRENERERATEDLVERLLDVRDNLQRALEQDEDDEIREGVEATLRQFDQVLERENVDQVEPDPGDEVDPRRHEVLMRVESDQPPGTVADVHRSGYVMGDKVLRPSQVTVSKDDSSSGDERDGGTDAGAGDGSGAGAGDGGGAGAGDGGGARTGDGDSGGAEAGAGDQGG